jgi:non-ribosomal peptide synthetase component F
MGDRWTVADLVHERALACPSALAVEDAEMELTYRDLDRWATVVARVLGARGAGRKSVVGIFLPRSARFAAGAFGVLKAGAAYLELDPEDPVERTEFLLRDSGSTYVLTSQELADQVPVGPWQTIVLTSMALRAGAQPDSQQAGIELAPAPARAALDDLACLVYSADSGERRVGVTHRGLLDLNASGPEIWPCLAAGATLQIPEGPARNSYEGRPPVVLPTPVRARAARRAGRRGTPALLP